MSTLFRFVVRVGALALFAMAAGGCQSQYLNPGTTPTSPSGQPTPYIASLSPASGSVGSSVTVAGLNFGAAQGTNTLMFGNVAATATSWATNSIVARVPAGATTGSIVVNAGGLPSNGVSFTVTP
jgi:hypothetical protein